MLKEKISQMVDQVIYHPVNRGKGAFFGVEPEITAKLEWGVDLRGAHFLQRSDLCRRQKVNWKDGVRASYAIMKYNLQRRHGIEPR